VVLKSPQIVVVRCGSSRIADRARKPLAMVRVKLVVNSYFLPFTIFLEFFSSFLQEMNRRREIVELNMKLKGEEFCYRQVPTYIMIIIITKKVKKKH
jgi:hypothetical protein